MGRHLLIGRVEGSCVPTSLGLQPCLGAAGASFEPGNEVWECERKAPV